MRVRTVDKGDAASCCDIYNYYIENSLYTLEFDPLSHQEFLERIERISASYPYIVCEDEGRVVGYAYLDPFGTRKGYRFTCDLAIYVDRNFRRKGAGGLLMDEILGRARKMGFKDVISVVTSENPASLAFHEKQGFKKAGVFEGVADKHGKRFDVVYLQKKLDGSPAE